MLEYNTLYQLYYKDRLNYESIYDLRYHSESTIHFDFEINGQKAFIYLHPMHFELTSQIYKIDKKVAHIYDQLPKVALDKYIRDTLVSEIKSTNDIEGVISTKKEIHEILNQVKGKKHNRLFGMVNRYKFLMEEKYSKLDSIKDVRLIFDELVSKEVYEGDSNNKLDGEIFRKNEVYLYKAAGSILHKGVIPESEIINLLSKSLNIYQNEQLDMLIRMSIFHYLFGYIHPFYDGNGRVNRFITSMMINKDLTPIMGYHISSQIKHNKKKYYDAFERTNSIHNKGDIGTFVYMFLTIIKNGFELALEEFSNLLARLNTYEEKLSKIDVFEENEKVLIYILIQNSLFSDMGISMKELEKYSKMSVPWIRKKVSYYIQRNLITKTRVGQNMMYNIVLEEFDQIYG